MKKYFLIVVISYCVHIVYAQEDFGMGCVYDPEIDGKVALAAPLLTRDYTIMPKQYSLKQYCPFANSQGNHGTCTSWATTYAARTICEAINNGWTDRQKITEEAFAPIFIYKQANDTSKNCQSGSCVAESLELLKTKGAPKLHSFNVKCADYIPQELFVEAKKYKIDNYKKLFEDTWRPPYRIDTWAFDTPHSKKIYSVKKALSENHPVVIAITCYDSFCEFNFNLWNGVQDSLMEGHALCVVGYDDEKYGGAFEIMNSWGTRWGDEGFIWVKYEDFCNNVRYAYDVYVRKQENYQVIPLKKNSLEGELDVKLAIDKTLHPTLKMRDSIAYYTLNHIMLSGDKFRLFITNNEPAYVYAISSDMENNVNQNFPPVGENISPALTYKSSHIAIPSEDYDQMLGNTKGKDFMCILYSMEALNIDSIIGQVKSNDGTFYQKVVRVVGDKLAPMKDVSYVQDKIRFSAKTDKKVVPLFVEWKHK